MKRKEWGCNIITDNKRQTLNTKELLNDNRTTNEANQPVQQDTPTGKELAADALDRIASKLGGKKNLRKKNAHHL